MTVCAVLDHCVYVEVMGDRRDLHGAVLLAIEGLESGVQRGRSGSPAAYQDVAYQLRKLLVPGQGNDLLLRVLPDAALHKLVEQPPPLSSEELARLRPGVRFIEEAQRGPQFAGIYAIFRLTQSAPIQVDLEFDLTSPPVPVREWREQELVRTSPPISVAQFIRAVANKDAVHADDKIGAEIVEITRLASGWPASQAVMVALGEYVVKRVRELLVESE